MTWKTKEHSKLELLEDALHVAICQFFDNGGDIEIVEKLATGAWSVRRDVDRRMRISEQISAP